MFKHSALRNLAIANIAFGIAMGGVFPLFVQPFVDWKPGMQIPFSLACVVAGLIVGAFNYGLTRFLLIRRLQALRAYSRAIAELDLDRRYDSNSADVIGELANDLNQTACHLSEFIGRVSEQARLIAESSGNVSQISDQAQNGADSQDEQIGHLLLSLENIAQSARQIVESTHQAKTATHDATRRSREGALTSSEALGSIERLVGDVDQATRIINKLSEETRNIGLVLEVIRGIAEQTNLLALNAAIEAARAGEQGRGFSVVADEVRTLANRTENSTREIDDMINRLRNDASEAVSSMQQAGEQARTTADRVENSAESLGVIAGDVGLIDSMIGEITDIAGRALDSVNRTDEKARNLKRLADDHAALAHRSADAGRTLAQASEQMRQLTRRFEATSRQSA